MTKNFNKLQTDGGNYISSSMENHINFSHNLLSNKNQHQTITLAESSILLSVILVVITMYFSYIL